MAVKHTNLLCFSPSLVSSRLGPLSLSLSLSPHPITSSQSTPNPRVSLTRIYTTLSPPSLFSFHASNKMDTADLEVMSCPPFDPAADVRITHTVDRTSGGDGGQHSRGVILNHYLRGPSVGKGQHGTVYQCWDLAQNKVEVVRLSSSISHFHTSTLPATPPPPVSMTNVYTSHPCLSTSLRPSKSCRDTIPAPTASTSSREGGSRVRGPTSPSRTTSAAKNTKSKKRSQS